MSRRGPSNGLGVIPPDPSSDHILMIVGVLQIHEGQIGPINPDPDPPPLPGGAADVVRFFMDVPQWIQIGGVVLGIVAVVVCGTQLWLHRVRIVAWIAELPAVVKASAIAVLVGGGAVASVAGYQVYDFVEHDNRFCTGCHIMSDAYLRFEASPHTALGCKECHAQPKTESARQLYLWVINRPHEVGPHSPVADARCTSCHVDQDSDQWLQISASVGHRVHFDSDEEDLGQLMCVTCHGVSVHEFTPAPATCGACHEAESTIRLGAMVEITELHCVACHDFLGDRPSDLPGAPEGMAMLPERAQCMACHEMSGLIESAGFDEDPHGAACGVCHNPHTQETAFSAAESCVGCHTDVEAITIFHTGTHAPVLPNCMECHSAHGWQVQGSECLDCHESVLGAGPENVSRVGWAASLHPAALPSRPTGPAATADEFSHHLVASARGALVRTGLFPNENPRLAPPELSLMDGTSSQPWVGASVDVDSTQDPRPFLHREHEGLSCLECHGSADQHGILTVQTSRDCAACHHDPGRGFVCEACHASSDLEPARRVSASMALTVWDEVRARELEFQHGGHEGIGCQECHTGDVLLAVEIQCAACHDDHHRAEADCSSCHLPSEPGVHGLEVHLTCTSSGCHAGTAGERPTLTRSLCLTCHVDQRDHEVGLECWTCHMVPLDPPARIGA